MYITCLHVCPVDVILIYLAHRHITVSTLRLFFLYDVIVNWPCVVMSLWLLVCLFSDNRHSVATNSLVTHRRWNVITCMWNVQVVFHAFSKLQPYSGREMCILRMLLLLLRWSLVSVCAAVSICWCYAVVQFVSFICHTYTYVVVYWHWWANIQGATPHPPAASRSGKNDANSWFSLAMEVR